MTPSGADTHEHQAHRMALREDIRIAVGEARGLCAQLSQRVLVVFPSGKLARSGGERNLTLVAAGLRGLGREVTALCEPGEQAAFLRGEGVHVLPALDLALSRETQPLFFARFALFAAALEAWKNAPADPRTFAATQAAFNSAFALVDGRAPAGDGVPLSELVSVADSRYASFHLFERAARLRYALEVAAPALCIVDFFPHCIEAALAADTLATHLVAYAQNADFVPHNRLLADKFHIIACSKTALEQKFVGMVLRKPVHIVPNGLATYRLEPSSPAKSAFRAHLRLPHDAVLLGQVAALEKVKDQRTVVAAMHAMADAWPQAYLALVGDDRVEPYVTDLRVLVASSRLGERIKFVGYRADIKDIYAALDIFVSASRREGFGLAAAEAMLCGKPCVFSEIIPSQALGGSAALYFAPGDAQQLAAQLLQLRDPERRAALGKQARKRAQQTIESQGSMLAHFASALERIDAQRP